MQEQTTQTDQTPALTFGDTDAEFRRFVEATEDYAILLMNPEGYITTWSFGAERVLGYTAQEVIGKNLSLIFTQEALKEEIPNKELRTAIADGRYYEEGWHRRKDGSRFWASGVLAAFKDDSGNLRGFCKIVRDLTRQHEQQESVRNAAEKDRRIAHMLQQAMLVPVKEDQFPNIVVATLYESAWDEADVGGDFYDAFLLSDNLLALAVGDASGKGLDAAVRTTQIKDVLRAFLRSSETADAVETMGRLNDFLCSSKRLDRGAEEGFVCLSLVLLDTATGKATAVVAGAECPIVFRETGRKVESIVSSGMPLGIFPAQTYQSQDLKLEPGDALLLVTDGITEARCGKEFLDFHRLAELAQKALLNKSIATVAREVLDGAKAFAGGKLHDDACLLMARRTKNSRPES